MAIHDILKRKEASLIVVILVLTGAITAMNRSFLTFSNINDILRSYSVHGIVALGMLMVILTSGIDVSVGSMAAVVTVVIGKFLVNIGGNVPAVLLLAGATGILLGLVNAFIIVRLKIPAIVVTLGTLNIFRGIELYITGGSWITGLPDWFILFGKIKILGIPIQTVFWIVAAVLTYLILMFTRLGRGVYAIGGNQEAAERVGYKSRWIKVFVWAYLGLMVGIAGIMHTSIVRHVDPNAFSSFELIVIAACVLGGANVFGGEGTILGTFLGILILAIIDNGLIMAHIPSYGHQVIVGTVIIAAVSLDVINERRQSRGSKVIDIDYGSKHKRSIGK